MKISEAFQQLHRSLLEEAVSAPDLFSDLAGLEQYVSESYNARSFIELLQNADDAAAKRFHIESVDGFLVIANDGVEFKPTDFESLCRSSASSKSRGETIGYRGIGFKSVVGFAERVHLVSGELSTTFCRRLTTKEVPGSSRVPLIRIPHALDFPSSEPLTELVRRLKSDGYTTFFVFEQIDHRSVLTEFQSFESDSFLFLRSVAEANIVGETSEKFEIETLFQNEVSKRLAVSSRAGRSEWVLRSLGTAQVAFTTANGIPEPVPRKQAVAHAFLPTNEPTGFGVKINGDFSTDPSRTKVVLDDHSAACIQDASRLILNCLQEAIAAQSQDRAKPFVALNDLRMSEFAKPSFEQSLASAVLNGGKTLMRSLRLRPSWLESHNDFEAISRSAGLTTISAEMESLEGFPTMLRALGAVTLSGAETALALGKCTASISTSVATLGYFNELESTGQLGFDIQHCRVWPTKKGLATTAELKQKPVPLTEITLLVEKFGSRSALLRFVKKHFGSESSQCMIPEADEPRLNEIRQPGNSSSVGFLEKRLAGAGSSIDDREKQIKANHNHKFKRWRTVEIQVKEYLESQGWDVTDVSLRNLGYDLEAISPDSTKHFFEVKSISRVGELFSLTSNEEVVAREKGEKYVLVIAMLTDEFFDIEFIADPINQLQLVRQCKQWAWICETYPYNPERIVLAD